VRFYAAFNSAPAPPSSSKPFPASTYTAPDFTVPDSTVHADKLSGFVEDQINKEPCSTNGCTNHYMEFAKAYKTKHKRINMHQRPRIIKGRAHTIASCKETSEVTGTAFTMNGKGLQDKPSKKIVKRHIFMRNKYITEEQQPVKNNDMLLNSGYGNVTKDGDNDVSDDDNGDGDGVNNGDCDNVDGSDIGLAGKSMMKIANTKDSACDSVTSVNSPMTSPIQEIYQYRYRLSLKNTLI
jgi:hypothetical protein